MLVDTHGFLLPLLVHEANIQDHVGGKLLLSPLRGVFPRLKLIWADSAYEKGHFETWVKERFGWDVEIVKHWWSGRRSVWVAPGQEPPTIPSGFHVLKWRWMVERFFAWTTCFRRMVRDDERLPGTLAGLHQVVFACLMRHQFIQLSLSP